MTRLQTDPSYIAGLGSRIVLLEKQIVSKSERSARHAGERLHPNNVGL